MSVLTGTERGHVADGEFPPKGEHGGQRGTDFPGSKLQKSMPGAARESLLKAFCNLQIHRFDVVCLRQQEMTVRSQNWDKKRRIHI
jgi:hypothetical protein